MKILKYGEGYPKTAICGNCNSVLQYELDDVYYRSERERSADPLIVYEDVDIHEIKCPVCGNYVSVNRKVTHVQLVERRWQK